MNAIKHRIKFKQGYRDRRTSSASGVPLDVSDNPQGSDEARRRQDSSSELDGESADDMDFINHLKNFFKGEK